MNSIEIQFFFSVCDLTAEKLEFQLVQNFSLQEKSVQVWKHQYVSATQHNRNKDQGKKVNQGFVRQK